MPKIYEPSLGEDISTACAEALKLAKESNEIVGFNFNGILVAVTPDDTVERIYRRYVEKVEKRRREYLESEEYRIQQLKRAEEVKIKQQKVNALIAEAPEIIDGGSYSEILDWLVSFADSADDVDVSFDVTPLYTLFCNRGFKANENVGLENTAYADKATLARYIIGQALDNLEHGMAPHPILHNFVQNWKKL